MEADAGWVPHFKFRLDHAYERHRHHLSTTELQRLPGEYVDENVYVTFQDDYSVKHVTGGLDLGRVMWATDFPHSDGTYPYTREVIDQVTEGLTPTARDALLPSLRSSKEHGQSNFVNPGLWLWGLGADFDVLPELRIITNATSLEFDNTAVLRTTRNQRAVGSHIGFDLSTGIIYRPWFINNVVFNVSGAILVPGDGLKDLYEDRYDVFYSTIFNMILTY